MFRKGLFTLLIFAGFYAFATAQTPLPADWKSQLDALGITEAEVAAKMAEKGIDINNIDPSEVENVQATLEEVIAELQAEKAGGAVNSQADNPSILPADKPENPAGEVQKAAGEEEVVPPDTSDVKEEEPQSNNQSATAYPPVKVFGQQLFRDQNFQLQIDAQNVKPTDAYVLGPGDEISIAIFGASQASFNFVITPEGYIQPPGMGRLYLKGMKLGQARELLRKKFGQYYSFGAGEFAVSVSYSRVITVNVVGEVFKPGSYNLTAGNTVFNALVATGGPTDIGSLRQIRLLRNGEKPRIFDVYEFLHNPLTEQDFFLRQNDYIHVPVSGKLVKIEGAVKRPHTYEMVEGETLSDLINLAGGLAENAYKKQAQIIRYDNDLQQVIDVDLNQVLKFDKPVKLLDGDVVSIKFIEKPAENFVEITGTVQFPGQYQWFDGMRVTDLAERGGLERESRRDMAYLFRTLPDETVQLLRIDLGNALKDPVSAANIRLKPKDKLQIFSLVAFADKATLSTSGAVRTPTEIPFDPRKDTRVSDLILLSDGIQPNAADYAYIKRVNWRNKTDIDYIRFNVKEALADTSSLENHILQPFDEVIVYTNEQFADEAQVSIAGAVRAAGSFDYDSGLRVSDLVYFANGLKKDAADIAFITRTDPATKAISYLRVNLAKALKKPGGAEDVLLMPFDQIDVPSRADFLDERTVEVLGAVRKPGTFQYHEGMDLKEVLLMADGLKFQAARDRIEISRLVLYENQPTESAVIILSVDDSLNVAGGQPYYLQPYDKVIVRAKPEFSFQRTVTIEGEVRYPGVYTLKNREEHLADLIARAGGLTEEAFPEAATLYRNKDDIGYVVTNLEKAINRPNSRFNYVLQEGDKIVIPGKQTFVSISGAVQAEELFQGETYKDGIKVPYHKGKRARYYIRHYAGGLSKDGRYRKTVVVYPNGKARKSTSWGLFVWTPKVKPGSEIIAGRKEPKPDKEGEKNDIDWNEVILDSVTQITAILSLVLLVKQLNK